MYEDVTEGTPLSPVFATADAMVRWLMEPHPIGWGGRVISMSESDARRWVEES